MITELTKTAFLNTFGKKMIDVSQTASPEVDIWPYVQQLKEEGIVSDYVFANQLVEFVYRNQEETFDHVLLPTNSENVYVIIVVDLNLKQVKGHHKLDLNEEYGMR